MTTLSSETLITAAERLIKEIGVQAGKEDTLQLQQLEQCARALNAQLKAIQELEAHNQRQTQHETGQTFTRYEDLPPLMPEDRERLKEELINKLSSRGTGKPKSGLSPLS